MLSVYSTDICACAFNLLFINPIINGIVYTQMCQTKKYVHSVNNKTKINRNPLELDPGKLNAPTF